MSELTVRLDPADLETLAQRVAELLADRTPVAAPGPAPDMLTVPQAAALLGVTPKTVTNYLSAGRLARGGVPKRPLVSREEVEALARGEARPRPAQRVRRPGPAGEAFTRRARRG